MRLRNLLKHLLVPHRSNAFRPHAFRHNALSLYLLMLLILQISLGAFYYAGPSVRGTTAENLSRSIVSLSNAERAKKNEPALNESSFLDVAAQAKLTDMFSKNYWDHTGPKGETAWEFINDSGYKYEVAGENLARGFDDSGEVMEAWMQSKTHRENILDGRFTEIGVAVGTGKIRGMTTTLIVQLFGKPQTAFAQSGATPRVAASTTIIPEMDGKNATAPDKAPYLIIWMLIFGLIVIDGIMIRKLGLHNSPKHLFSFRMALFMSILLLAALSVGVAAIA